MKSHQLLSYRLGGLLATICLMTGLLYVYAADTDLTIEIIPGVVSIVAPTSLSFSAPITALDEVQTPEEEFDGADQYFMVTDLKGADEGYNTTLQLSGDLVAGSNSIAAANVSFKANDTAPTLLSGTANTAVVLDAGTQNYQTLASARSFIKRNTASNDGKIGKYGSQIWIEIEIPGFQAVGSYQGTLVYTLIEN